MLTRIARRELREKFLQADMGITGANFAVADTGTIVLVTNEGNGRMVTSLPRVHVAVMGMEKVIPCMTDLMVFLAILAKSATGQKLSVYTTLVRGPRRPGELEGPEEFHLVLLDNGRIRQIAGTLREALYCLRCGACLNVCPVYRQIGGHAYGYTYPGPIGILLTAMLEGDRAVKDLAHASSLCGACKDACPVRIDIPRMLVELREHLDRGSIAPRGERLVFGLARRLMRVPRALPRRGASGPLAAAPVRPRAAGSAACRSSSASGRPRATSRRWPRGPSPSAGRSSSRWPPGPSSSSACDARWPRRAGSFPPRWPRGRRGPRRPPRPCGASSPSGGRTPSSASRPSSSASAASSTGWRGWRRCRRWSRRSPPRRERARSWAGTRRRWAGISRPASLRTASWCSPPRPVKGRRSGRRHREEAARAPLGVTGADWALAETGTLILLSGAGRPRSTSLLPDTHVAVFGPGALLESLAQVGVMLEAHHADRAHVDDGGAINFITGPTRTADIELTLTRGVHGPKEVHAVFVDALGGSA